MAIVQSHRKGEIQYKSDTADRTVAVTIKGQEVKLHITYGVDSIIIKTEGMNEAVYSYLNQTYGDGLTFEVWNYFKDKVDGVNVTREYIKGMLDGSTITFSNDVESYVNAFGAIYD